MWKREVKWFLLAFALVTVVLLLGNSHWRRHVEPEVFDGRSTGPDYSLVPANWAGRDACAECHAEADSVWAGSDHDLAMQIPGPETVTADFNNSTFTHFGVTTTFFRSGDKYMVRTDGPDGNPTDFEVAYVFGFYPLEQYLIRFPDGRMQALNVCWDTHLATEGGQRWYHLYPEDETASTDLFHWTGMLQNWNFMCAECHSTNLRTNYDAPTDTYATVWSELDVSCEACHGPGSRHITWERSYARGLRPRDEAGTRALVVNLKSPDQGQWLFEADKPTAVRSDSLASRIEVESCARCHARRSKLTTDYEYGRPFLDNYRLTLLDEFLYTADGQNQDEVYVYGSFLQSKMYAAGVTCSDCHDYHSTKTINEGNQVCARCHKAEIYDTYNHHFHQPGKGGDSCLDCHQQARKVMGVDARRDHSFRIPRPDLSLEFGTPNACSDCHEDKPVQWSQDAIAKWYGDDQKSLHFTVALNAGRTGIPGALFQLRFLIGTDDNPNIARATALSLVPRFKAASEVHEVVQALSDGDPLVRGAAVRALLTSAPERQLMLALPLLEDEVRDVRIAAAEVVASLPRAVADPSLNQAVATAHNVWRQYLNVGLDRPESRLGLAALHIKMGEMVQAEENFRSALKIEPRYAPGYVNYADFLRRSQRIEDAVQVLMDGISTATEPADLHYALALLFVTQKNLSAAFEQLELAISLRENSARFAYVYGVALHDSGEVAKSLDVLEESLGRNPWDQDTLMALMLYSMEAGQPGRALDSAQRLVDLNPQDIGAERMLARVHEAAAQQQSNYGKP